MKIFKNQKGAVAVMTALLFPLMLTFTGIAVDVGRLYVEKAKMQNLADAAATAALAELKKTTDYKEGSGTLTPTIPIGAISHNTASESSIKTTGSRAANLCLKNNESLGVFRIPNPNDPSDPSNSSSAGGSSASSSSVTSDDVKAEGNVYVLKNSALEDQNIEYRYYYEVILSKKFPVYFARFVHPDDVLVRAGAVCVIDIKEEDFNPSYAYALANWQSYSQSYLQRYISSSKRLNADREALENIARYFLNQDKSLLTNIYENYTSGKEIYLRDYIEDKNNIGSINSSLDPDNDNKNAKFDENHPDELIHWMQGDYGNWTGDYNADKDLNTDQRYLFSDFAISNNNRIAATFTIKDNTITSVRVRICPRMAATGGSGPLDVRVSL